MTTYLQQYFLKFFEKISDIYWIFWKNIRYLLKLIFSKKLIFCASNVWLFLDYPQSCVKILRFKDELKLNFMWKRLENKIVENFQLKAK
jgi:hypothetical protein